MTSRAPTVEARGSLFCVCVPCPCASLASLRSCAASGRVARRAVPRGWAGRTRDPCGGRCDECSSLRMSCVDVPPFSLILLSSR